ncbi:hypothetical protein [Pseudanabaena sp. 'Roaring Creek']|uniref:hypothetical protein n=1 Tax=Pseudanabaena sp. 'Roaring Creek' TaxID=1681830 RepID=UPI0006D7C9B6|nr:hypothetical protein [Pseudanabaena sp. 'Roaring Creek']
MINFWERITGRSRIKVLEEKLVSQALLYAEAADDILVLSDELIKVREAFAIASKENTDLEFKKQIERNKFQILYCYVNRIASAIAGEEVVIPIAEDVATDIALNRVIESARQQNNLLLISRVRIAKLEVTIANAENIISEIPSDGAIE